MNLPDKAMLDGRMDGRDATVTLGRLGPPLARVGQLHGRVQLIAYRKRGTRGRTRALAAGATRRATHAAGARSRGRGRARLLDRGRAAVGALDVVLEPLPDARLVEEVATRREASRLLPLLEASK